MKLLLKTKTKFTIYFTRVCQKLKKNNTVDCIISIQFRHQTPEYQATDSVQCAVCHKYNNST